MSVLEPAADRLDAALSRLEAAVEGLTARMGDPLVLRAELAALVTDRSKLAEDLDASLARERQLQTLADEASVALGAAIREVRAALEAEDEFGQS